MQEIGKKRFCLFCGAELVGRSDKKYCDDVCRNNYHYRHYKNENMIVETVNKVLKNNRNVIKSLCNNGKRIVKTQILIDSKFDFNIITGVYKTIKNKEYRLIYDYAYMIMNEDYVMLIKYCK